MKSKVLNIFNTLVFFVAVHSVNVVSNRKMIQPEAPEVLKKYKRIND